MLYNKIFAWLEPLTFINDSVVPFLNQFLVLTLILPFKNFKSKLSQPSTDISEAHLPYQEPNPFIEPLNNLTNNHTQP